MIQRFDIYRFLSISLVISISLSIYVLLKFQEPLYIIAVYCMTTAAILFFLKTDFFFWIMVIYISLVPAFTFKPDFFPLYTTFNIILPFVLLYALQIGFSSKVSFNRYHMALPVSGKVLSLFLIFVVVSICIGFTRYNNDLIIAEAEYLSFYLFYFLIVKFKNDLKWVKKFILGYLIISIIVSIEFIGFVINHMDLASMLFNRFVTQQPFLSLFSVPLFLSYIIMQNEKINKILFFLAIIINLSAVILSQWRALTGGVVLSILLFLLIYMFRNGITFKLDKKVVRSIIFASLTLFSIVLYVFNRYLSLEALIDLFGRYDSISNIGQDSSWNMRADSFVGAINHWIKYPIFGAGFGAVFKSSNYTLLYNNIIDNSYIYLMWKTGLLGIGLYLTFTFLVLRKGFIVIAKEDDGWKRFMMISIVSGFIGLLFSSYFYLTLTRYRFIIFWAIFLGIIEVIYYDFQLERNIK